MRSERCAQGRNVASVALCTALAITLGCAERTQSVEPESRVDATTAIVNSCAAYVRGRNLGVTTAVKSIERSLAVGDTAHLTRITAELSPSMAPSAWSVENADLARIDSGVVIPLAAGHTRLNAQVGGRTLCVALTTLFAGASLNAITLPAPDGDVTEITRLDATLRYSNGLSLKVHEAAQWTSLDPSIAGVSSSAWVTPLQNGTARVVARIGNVSDTVALQVRLTTFESLPPRRAEDFVNSIGVNIHLSYFDRVYGSGFRSIIIPRLQELNVRHVRDGGTTLPNEDWMREVYGRWRELADATNAKFTVIMSPRRTETGPGTNYSDMSHVRELRDRIGEGRIAAFEGLNEHDLSGRPAFAQEVGTLQRALYATIKGDPSLASRFEVLGPSLANVSTATQVGDLSAYMDAGVIHPYDGGQIPTSNLRSNVEGIRAISGNDALVATEVGYHTAATSNNPWHWALSEQAQAKYTVRQFLELFNAGVRRAFAYELIDEGVDPSDMEQNFGLLRNDGSTKPAFTALRNLIAILGDRNATTFTPTAMRVSIIGDTVGVHRLVLEKRNGRQYLVLWQNTLSFDKVLRTDLSTAGRALSVQLPAPATAVNVYAPLAGAAALASYPHSRTVAVAVGDHPIVIEIVK